MEYIDLRDNLNFKKGLLVQKLFQVICVSGLKLFFIQGHFRQDLGFCCLRLRQVTIDIFCLYLKEFDGL